ncbi:unnamed protein product [Colias eurytheme]|nr:unnamed protein product [Colias eurytheme]
MMEEVQLPMEKACEPAENARQPQMHSGKEKGKKNTVTFENDLDNSKSRNDINRGYKEVLSQPQDNITQLQKLQWLQKRRSSGLWAQCDTCDKWRYLPHILERYELPKKWYCKMNPDTKMSDCSIPEIPIHLHDEEDLIHSEYAAGSLVLARLPGWPWWPAMVDDCPDTEQYYWLDGFSDIPTHYNVVFFDTDATRAWLAPNQLKPYGPNRNILKTSLKKNAYKKRLEVSIAQCEDAEKLSLTERLQKYSFINRYKGPIVSPKKINKKDAQKYRRHLKRKYDVDLPQDFFESDEDTHIENKEEMIKENVIIVGSKKTIDDSKNDDTSFIDVQADKINKDASLIVQVGTDKDDQTKEMTTENQLQNKNSTTSLHFENGTPEVDTMYTENNTNSPHSDDFDF